MFSKIELSRTWHRQLEIEVNDIRQTIPLITEKAQTELVAIAKVDEALKETEHELMLSRAKNADTLDKCTKTNQRVGTERDEIRAEIDRASKSLQRIAFVSLRSSILWNVDFALEGNCKHRLINIKLMRKRFVMRKKQ